MKAHSTDIITQLEHLDLHFSDKVELLLVYAGEKPATEWHRAQTYYFPDRPPDHRGRELFDQVAEWVKHAKLAHEVTEERVNTARELYSGVEGERLLAELAAKKRRVDVDSEIARSAEEDRLTLFVARDRDWLRKMREADRTRDPELLGECFGFPATAISAYVGHRAISPDRVRAPLATKAFAQFMLSRDHPQDDLATAERWAATVERLSPKLYAEVVESQLRRARLARRQLNVMLVSTGLLLIPQLGQFMAVRDLNSTGQESQIAFLFQFAALAAIPTSLILSGAIMWTVRHWWRSHEPLMILGAINALIALNLVIFLVNPCAWSQIFGLALRGCH